MKFRRVLKPLLGIMLIAISILMLFWWENAGREKFMMEERYVAAKDIEQGKEVRLKDFKLVVMNGEVVQKSAAGKEEIAKVAGLIANKPIRAGEQIHLEDFIKKEDRLKEGMSIYAIKAEWIDSRSCSLRKGDIINIYDAGGNKDLGKYKVAHVKNEAEQEVINDENIKAKDVFERDFANSPINFVEVFCSLEDYKRIYDIAENAGEKLLLVQEV